MVVSTHTVSILINFMLISSFIAAAKALIDVDGYNAEQIGRKSMKIAGDLCIYTNHTNCVEVIENKLWVPPTLADEKPEQTEENENDTSSPEKKD